TLALGCGAFSKHNLPHWKVEDEWDEEDGKAQVIINKEIHPTSGSGPDRMGGLGLQWETMWAGSFSGAQSDSSSHARLPTGFHASRAQPPAVS
ncbi:Ribonuclease 4, partial [Manis pentadactyla]